MRYFNILSDIMDFSVSDFNVRLRTIRLREFAVAIVVAVVITMLLVVLFPIMETYDDLMIVALVFLLLVFFAWALKNTDGFKRDINTIFEHDISIEILYVLIINLLFAFIYVSIISSFDIVFTVFDPTWIPSLDLSPVYYGDSIIYFLMLFTSVICAPLIEELSFRGVLFNRLKIRIGIVPAMLASSLLFALGHEFGGMLSAFLFGMCMCVLYLKTDNIFVPMTVHFLNNLLICIMEYFNMESVLFGTPNAFIMLVLSTVSAVLIIIYLVKETSKLTS